MEVSGDPDENVDPWLVPEEEVDAVHVREPVVFVVAFGVICELVEFYVGVVSQLLGAEEVLTQYGLDDTVFGLFYNTLGGLLVATFGTVHLTGLSDQLAERLDSVPRGR
ncbi:MAG: hypothetical protein ACQETI_12760 [Halobacteriota archaeon]